MLYNVYTQLNEDGFAIPQNKCHDRHQADYDYNGCIDADGDSADYFRPTRLIRATKVG